MLGADIALILVPPSELSIFTPLACIVVTQTLRTLEILNEILIISYHECCLVQASVIQALD